MIKLQNIRNINKVVIGFGLFLLCIIWAGLFFIVQSERRAEINNAIKDTGNYAQMFAEHTVRTLKGLEQVALFLKYQAEKEGLELDIPRYVKEERFAGQPYVLLSVVDETGDLVSSSQTPFVFSNIGDREHFMVHKAADIGTFIGKPVLGRSSGKWSIQLTRRVNKADGSFGGVVVVSVDPYYFAKFYKQVNLGELSNIAIIGRDGILRVRQSGSEVQVGLDFRRRMKERMSDGDAGHYIDQSIVDGVTRIFSYRALHEYPLFVTVGVTEEHIFADLHQRVISYLLLCGSLSVGISLFLALLLNVISRRNKAEMELRRNVRIQTTLREIADATVRSTSLTELYWTVHKLAGRVLPDANFFIAMQEDITADIVLSYCVGETQKLPQRRPTGKGLVEYVMRQRRAMHISPVGFERLFEQGEVRLRYARIQDWLIAPLIDSHGRAFGAIGLNLAEESQSFQPEDVEVLSIIAAQVSLAIDRKSLEEELHRQATTDGLTGIFNRRYFLQRAEEELKRIYRHERTCTMLMIDIDHFKMVNDNFGHAVGDAALQEVALLCGKILRGTDLLGRIGGEEFAVLLVETDLSEAMKIAERLRQTIQDNNFTTAQGVAVPLRVSIGAAELQSKTEMLSELMNRSDNALYRAKNEGRNRVVGC